MEDCHIIGLYKEVYGVYEGQFKEDAVAIYRTTDRYFEKYVLYTTDGIYELWAGGFRKKEDGTLSGFKEDESFAIMNGLRVLKARSVVDTLLALSFEGGQCFTIGLCPEYNRYHHPERFLHFRKTPGNTSTA